MTGAVRLRAPREIAEARELIEADGLQFENDADDMVGVYDGDRLIATASRAGYVFKMFAIDPGYRGGEAFGELITELLRSGRAAGHSSFFVYTRPEHAQSFEAANFRLLVAHGPVALLEYGGGLEAYLDAHSRWQAPAAGSCGSVVVNANPFTLGHLHLVERAAARTGARYLFVVREDRSVFPFAIRERLVRAGTSHLPNVRVLDTSRYSISAATFPSYFLKKVDAVALAQMQIDLRLFASRIAPYFSIRSRFVGEEPYCATTAAYNRAMAEVLPEYGIDLVVIPRKEHAGAAISATRVREAMAAGVPQTIEACVPPSTYQFLRSAEGEAIAARLRERSRHESTERTERTES
ncbi:MAG: citrate lyase ligase [Candidatus Eisenbacteria bacterium]|nr:citrate lyase ligase [Candidatus Eisenbacteria bacterium]